MIEVPYYRPPSEAYSLLIRATRNCPWNKCGFCNMYRGKAFSLRPVEEVLEDINHYRVIWEATRHVSNKLGLDGVVFPQVQLNMLQATGVDIGKMPWIWQQELNVFLADSDSLTMPAQSLATILRHLRSTFPEIKRVTSYARARTLLRRSAEDLAMLRSAGLDRLHIGLESGDHQVLELIQKGASPAQMIEGCQRARRAGFEISLYVILGLGGKELTHTHSLHTAKVLNEINPDFIRLRTLTLIRGTPLAQKHRNGEYTPLSPVEVLLEERNLLTNLQVDSQLVSDHVSNYLSLNGKLPDDQQDIIAKLDAVLDTLQQTPGMAAQLLTPESLRQL